MKTIDKINLVLKEAKKEKDPYSRSTKAYNIPQGRYCETLLGNTCPFLEFLSPMKITCTMSGIKLEDTNMYPEKQKFCFSVTK